MITNGTRVRLYGALVSLALAVSAAAAEMKDVRLLIQKLRDSMAALSELDELERAGMSHADVERMRKALKRKIQQMIDETIQTIQEL